MSLIVVLLAAGGALVWLLGGGRFGTQIVGIGNDLTVQTCSDNDGDGVCDQAVGSQGAQLTLTPVGGGAPQTGQTDAGNPSYTFTGLADGDYSVGAVPNDPGESVTSANPQVATVAGAGTSLSFAIAAQQTSSIQATLSKSAVPTSAQPGGTVSYTLSWQVTGGGFTGPMQIVDDYDEASVVGISGVSNGGVDSGSTITWSFPPLDLSSGSQSGSLTYVATLTSAFPTLPANVANSATLSIVDPTVNASAAGNVTVSGQPTQAPEPELTIVKNVVDVDGGLVERGDTLRYSISVGNVGAGTATGVHVHDNVGVYLDQFTVVATPAGSTDASVPNGGTNGNGYLDVHQFSIAPAAQVLIEYTVVVASDAPDSTPISNVAVASDDQGDVVQDDADVVVSVVAPPVALVQAGQVPTTPAAGSPSVAVEPEIVETPVTGIDPFLAVWLALAGAVVAAVVGYATYSAFKVLR